MLSPPNIPRSRIGPALFNSIYLTSTQRGSTALGHFSYIASPCEKSITSSSVPCITRTGDEIFGTLSMLKGNILTISNKEVCSFIIYIYIKVNYGCSTSNHTLEMRQKTRCVLSVEMQRAFLTLRQSEGQLRQLRNEKQGQQ